MLKIVANVSKKVPVPGVEYSSQSYMAGIEVEVADSASNQELQDRIHEVYGLLEKTIDKEISAQQALSTSAEPVNRISDHTRPRDSSNNGNNGNGRHATEAQVKAIFAIAKSNGMTRDTLLDLVWREYHADNPEALSVRSASKLIERLKSR